MKKQQGFTLIELIVVIVIIAILAAVAIPRFAAFDKQSRVASMRSLEGSVWSAASIVHAQSLIDNNSSSNDATVTVEGKTIEITYGYPKATEAGIIAAMGSISGYKFENGVFDFTNPRANCNVQYTAPTTENTIPDIKSTLDGC